MKSDSDKSETVTKPEAQGTLAATACSACRWWGEPDYEWDGYRPCNRVGDAESHAFVGGGDNNDGLYTKPDFGCVDG